MGKVEFKGSSVGKCSFREVSGTFEGSSLREYSGTDKFLWRNKTAKESFPEAVMLLELCWSYLERKAP